MASGKVIAVCSLRTHARRIATALCLARIRSDYRWRSERISRWERRATSVGANGKDNYAGGRFETMIAVSEQSWDYI